jgi:putative IMPACT (imprinted ancient) family translation regulator
MGTLGMDFGDGVTLGSDFYIYEKIIEDRGSVYSVAVGKVSDRQEIKAFLKKVKALKNHHKASHHSWAVRIANEGVIYESKSDDGETGAGNVILRMVRKSNNVNTVVCVVRWFGGVMLHAARFKHLQEATIYGLHEANEN